MIINAIKCETCDKMHNIDASQRSYSQVPSLWFLIYQGSPEGKEGYHFCSPLCVKNWLMKSSPEATQPLVKAPQYSTRRFLLFDKGDVGIVSGVKWGNGRVSIEPPYDTGTYTFPSWDKFRESYPDANVAWIDAEVKS